MDKSPIEPMAQLILKLDEARNLPVGPERDAKYKEAEELFGLLGKELSVPKDTFDSRNQNGSESLKTFMKKAGVDIPTITRMDEIVSPFKPSPLTRIRNGVNYVRGLWDRKKGTIAVGMTLLTALFFYANQRNIKMLNDFTHDEDLVGLFEDWLGLTEIEDEEDRETPLNWRELKEATDV